MLEIINVIERVQIDLKSLGLEKEISNSTIVSMIAEKLPESIGKEWIKVVNSKTQPGIATDNVPTLRNLLLEFRERIEYKFCNLRERISEPGHLSHTLLVDRKSCEQKPPCWMHHNHHGHPIWRCKAFDSKSASEKVKLVWENNACFRCLEQGHTTKSCRRNFTCREDGWGMPHHYMLHQAHTSSISSMMKRYSEWPTAGMGRYPYNSRSLMEAIKEASGPPWTHCGEHPLLYNFSPS